MADDLPGADQQLAHQAPRRAARYVCSAIPPGTELLGTGLARGSEQEMPEQAAASQAADGSSASANLSQPVIWSHASIDGSIDCVIASQSDQAAPQPQQPSRHARAKPPDLASFRLGTRLSRAALPRISQDFRNKRSPGRGPKRFSPTANAWVCDKPGSVKWRARHCKRSVSWQAKMDRMADAGLLPVEPNFAGEVLSPRAKAKRIPEARGGRNQRVHPALLDLVYSFVELRQESDTLTTQEDVARAIRRFEQRYPDLQTETQARRVREFYARRDRRRERRRVLAKHFAERAEAAERDEKHEEDPLAFKGSTACFTPCDCCSGKLHWCVCSDEDCNCSDSGDDTTDDEGEPTSL
jgi:hypothetical protein